MMASHLPVSVAQKQAVLEMTNVVERFEYLLGLMQSEADLLQVEKRIRGRVKKQMEKSQRDYYLNEQIKAIQKELGETENTVSEIEQLRQSYNMRGKSFSSVFLFTHASVGEPPTALQISPIGISKSFCSHLPK